MAYDKSTVEICFDIIESACRDFDFLADPDIEENMVCDFDCCVIHSWSRDMFNNPSQELCNFVGDEGIQLVQQLDKDMIRVIKAEHIEYGEKEGFSKTQEWFDFVKEVNKVNLFLKNILKKHGRH